MPRRRLSLVAVLKDTLGPFASLSVETFPLSPGASSTSDKTVNEFRSDGAQNKCVAFALDRNLGPVGEVHLLAEVGRYDHLPLGTDVGIEGLHSRSIRLA